MLEPDLLIVLQGGRATIEEAAISGPADVVIEILSPGTAKRIYEAHAVSEYWIVDPKAGTIDVLAHDGAAFVRHGLFGAGEVLGSRVLPQLRLSLDDVFAAAR